MFNKKIIFVFIALQTLNQLVFVKYIIINNQNKMLKK